MTRRVVFDEADFQYNQPPGHIAMDIGALRWEEERIPVVWNLMGDLNSVYAWLVDLNRQGWLSSQISADFLFTGRFPHPVDEVLELFQFSPHVNELQLAHPEQEFHVPGQRLVSGRLREFVLTPKNVGIPDMGL